MPIMASGLAGAQDVSAVMANILTEMDRVVEHLRSQGEINAANDIAREVCSIASTFNNATAPWDIEKSLMYGKIQHHIRTSPSTARDSSQSASKASGPNTTSWAAVAAVAPASANRVVKFTSSDVQQQKKQATVAAQELVQTSDTDNRVIWIRGWKECRPLREVTNKIGCGPIYSMAYSPRDASVCVIFLYASSAQHVYEEDVRHMKEKGSSMFGQGCDVVIGLPYPEDRNLLRMLQPFNERRRLTFARSQLFTNGLTEARFKQDLLNIVGPENLELVWLFNTGNATAIFAAVPIAKLVRGEFTKINQPNSLYRGVVVSFSHDPCERAVSLVTQMINPHTADRSMGTYGGHAPNDVPSSDPPLKDRGNRRNTRMAENGGWQVVRNKK